MSPEARVLAQALLDHHKRVCRPRSGAKPNIDSCLIRYGDLCEQAGLAHLKPTVGKFCARSRGGAMKMAGPRSIPSSLIMKPGGRVMGIMERRVAAWSTGSIKREIASLSTAILMRFLDDHIPASRPGASKNRTVSNPATRPSSQR